MTYLLSIFFFFFNDTATTEIYTLSLHDALPISHGAARRMSYPRAGNSPCGLIYRTTTISRYTSTEAIAGPARSEEHTSELQSQSNLVCRLLLEKKKKKTKKE